MFRAITALISTACFFILIAFTELTAIQFLLLIGILIFDAVYQWSRFLADRRK